MRKLIAISLIGILSFACADDNPIEQRLRSFPNNSIYATIEDVKYPTLTIEEIPSNFASGLLGMVMLKSTTIQMTPATIIRDKRNFNQLSQYIDNLKKQVVAIQPDYQGNAWVIWQLTKREQQWVIDNKFNKWQ